MDKYRIPDRMSGTSKSAEESKKQLNVIKARGSSTPGFFIPAGIILPYGGSTPPLGYFFCEGQSVSYTDFPALFDVIGYNFTSGTPSGTLFALPDLKGRVIVGSDFGAGRVSANNALGNSSGAQSHTLSTSQIPSHDHGPGTLSTNSTGAHTHDVSATQAANTTATGGQNRLTTLNNGNNGNNDAITSSDGAHSHSVNAGTTGTSGGGSSHNNMQPYLVLNYIIKY